MDLPKIISNLERQLLEIIDTQETLLDVIRLDRKSERAEQCRTQMIALGKCHDELARLVTSLKTETP